MNIQPIKKININEIADDVIFGFSDLNNVIFENKDEIFNAIKKSCSLIYPFIYLPTSTSLDVDNGFVTLNEHTRDIALICEYTKEKKFNTIRDYTIIPPSIESNDTISNWKIKIDTDYPSVIVFSELELYVKDEYVLCTDKACLVKQTIFEIARNRTLKRQSYDLAPAATQEVSSSATEMTQFAAVAFDELNKLLNTKKMERLATLMGLPTHVGNKSNKIQLANPEQSNSYISSRRK